MIASNDVLEGALVCLRRLDRTDLERTWDWLHRPDIYERIGVTVPFSRSMQEKWFESMEQARDKIVFAVCVREDRTHIGNASLGMIDYRHRNAALSIFIAEESTRRKGFGTDALRVLIRYAFDYFNLHRIWCKADADVASLEAFYTSLGFEVEGVLREHEYRDGSFIDKKVFGLINRGRGPRVESA